MTPNDKELRFKDTFLKTDDVIAFLREGGEEFAQGQPLEKIPSIKPYHGSCCTCQTCGQGHDECVCRHNETVEWLESHILKLRKLLNKAWTEGKGFGWYRGAYPGYYAKTKSSVLSRRNRDVSRIIEAKKKEQRKEQP